MRSLARDLNISPTTLHEVVSYKRHLSPKNLQNIAILLKWSDELTETAKLHIRYGQKDLAGKVAPLKKDVFSKIPNWFDFGILALCKIASNSTDPQWFAERLNISAKLAEKSLLTLEQQGLIVAANGSYKRTASAQFMQNLDNSAMRKHHQQFLSKAKKTTSEIWDDTLNYALTLPIDPGIIPKVKELSDGFLFKLLKLVETSRPTEVYTMAMTFFPLTTDRSRNKSKKD